jgi:hypothetical protein
MWETFPGDVAQIIADATRHSVVFDASITADQIQLTAGHRTVLTLHGPDTPGPAGRWLHETVDTTGMAWEPWLVAAMLRVRLVAPVCTLLASDLTWPVGWLTPRRIYARRFTAVPSSPSPLAPAAEVFAGIQGVS